MLITGNQSISPLKNAHSQSPGKCSLETESPPFHNSPTQLSENHFASLNQSYQKKPRGIPGKISFNSENRSNSLDLLFGDAIGKKATNKSKDLWPSQLVNFNSEDELNSSDSWFGNASKTTAKSKGLGFPPRLNFNSEIESNSLDSWFGDDFERKVTNKSKDLELPQQVSFNSAGKSNCWDSWFGDAVETKARNNQNWETYTPSKEPESLKRNRGQFEGNSDNMSSSNNNIVIEKKAKTQPTPGKKVKLDPNSFAGVALTIQSSNQQVITINGKKIRFDITPLEDDNGAKVYGDFVEVCIIAPNQPKLFEECANTQLLVKRYRKHVIEQRHRELEKYMKNSIEQYDNLLKANFPVSKILNRSTVFEDKFFIVEKINHEFPITWDRNSTFASMDEKSKWYLKQVKDMIEYAFKHNRLIDIKESNLRLNDQNKIILCDFMERTDLSFLMIIDNAIKSFANCNQSVADYLYPADYTLITRRECIKFGNNEVQIKF